MGTRNKFRVLDSKFLPLMEAAGVSEAPTGKRTVNEDIEAYDVYLNKTENTFNGAR